MKKIIYRFLFFIVTIITCQSLRAQTTFLDSLKKNIQLAPSPEKKLQARLAFCDEWESFNADTLYRYVNIARQEAATQNDQDAMLQCNYFNAVYLFQKNRIDSALKAIDLILASAAPAGVYNAQNSKFWYLRGNILMRTKDYQAVLKQDFSLLEQAEKMQDTIGMIRFNTGIGNVNLRLKKIDESIGWHHRAISLMTTDYLKAKCSFVFINLAVAYYHVSQFNDTKQTEDSIEMNLQKAIYYSRKGASRTNLANSLSAYGNTVAGYNKIKAAEEAMNEAISIRKSIGDPFYVIADMLALSSIYENSHNPSKAIQVCQQALEISKANGSDFMSLSTIYSSLGEVYAAAGDYKKGNEVLREQISLQDSLYKFNTANAVTEMQTKYEVQKKENTIILQKLDIAAKRNSIYAVSIVTALLLLGILLLFRYSYKKQQQQKQNEIIAVASAEEKERKRISADLHDNIGAYAAAAASTISTIRVKEGESAERLQLLNGNVQDMITQLNDSIWALNRKAVPITGISDRFKLFVRKLEHAYPDIRIRVTEEIGEDRILSPFQALHLFRIMQEALNNALRHSKCTEVAISIISKPDSFRITTVDNGIGMNPNLIKGNGINNLKQRASEAGWKLDWQDNPAGGTLVIITMEKV